MKYGGELPKAPEGFRVLEPIAAWSGSLALEATNADFEHAVCDASRSNQQRYSGYLTRNGSGLITGFTRSRYPRRVYEVLSVFECQRGMRELGTLLSTNMIEDHTSNDVRVMLGLREGYGNNSAVHSVESVAAHLPDSFTVTPGEIFAAKTNGMDFSAYGEPAAIIQGPSAQLADVYEIAADLKQERIAVEDFGLGNIYMVETPFCTQPD